jgi:hypothetical protein
VLLTEACCRCMTPASRPRSSARGANMRTLQRLIEGHPLAIDRPAFSFYDNGAALRRAPPGLGGSYVTQRDLNNMTSIEVIPWPKPIIENYRETTCGISVGTVRTGLNPGMSKETTRIRLTAFARIVFRSIVTASANGSTRKRCHRKNPDDSFG